MTTGTWNKKDNINIKINIKKSLIRRTIASIKCIQQEKQKANSTKNVTRKINA